MSDIFTPVHNKWNPSTRPNDETYENAEQPGNISTYVLAGGDDILVTAGAYHVLRNIYEGYCTSYNYVWLHNDGLSMLPWYTLRRRISLLRRRIFLLWMRIFLLRRRISLLRGRISLLR